MKALLFNVNKVDRIVISEVYTWRGKDFFDAFFCNVSKSGDGPLYVLMGLLLWVLDPQIGKQVLAAGLIAFSLELPTYKIAKLLIKRKRPFEKIQEIQFLIPPPDRFSFPSGHTASAFLMWVILCHFYPFWLIPGLIWASLIGFSRVYLCVHYPSDIFAGITLGILCAKFALFII